MTMYEHIADEVILQKATEKSFRRGREYFDSGMVESVTQRGNRLFAEVLGSEEDLYYISVVMEEGDFRAYCTCPYDWGGYCKHIVAVLLTWTYNRESVTVGPPIEDLLSEMDAGELRALFFRLLEIYPVLSEEIDEFSRKILRVNR